MSATIFGNLRISKISVSWCLSKYLNFYENVMHVYHAIIFLSTENNKKKSLETFFKIILVYLQAVIVGKIGNHFQWCANSLTELGIYLVVLCGQV